MLKQQLRLGILLLILTSACGKMPATTQVSKIPALTGAISSSSSSSSASARTSLPTEATTASTLGGLLIHDTVLTGNKTALDSVDASIGSTYQYTVKFFELAKSIDRKTCILNALKAGNLVNFDNSVQYFRTPSADTTLGDVIKLKIETGSEGGITSYLLQSCSSTSQRLYIKGTITSGQGGG
jgi:hypothetical protein